MVSAALGEVPPYLRKTTGSKYKHTIIDCIAFKTVSEKNLS
jgi:hypothetical protein